MAPIWNPRLILDCNPDGAGFSCVGTTKQGRRCRQFYFRGSDLREAAQILDGMAQHEPSLRALRNRLEALAGLTLCPRWHRVDDYSQVQEMTATWANKIRQYLAEIRALELEQVRQQLADIRERTEDLQLELRPERKLDSNGESNARLLEPQLDSLYRLKRPSTPSKKLLLSTISTFRSTPPDSASHTGALRPTFDGSRIKVSLGMSSHEDAAKTPASSTLQPPRPFTLNFGPMSLPDLPATFPVNQIVPPLGTYCLEHRPEQDATSLPVDAVGTPSTANPGTQESITEQSILTSPPIITSKVSAATLAAPAPIQSLPTGDLRTMTTRICQPTTTSKFHITNFWRRLEVKHPSRNTGFIFSVAKFVSWLHFDLESELFFGVGVTSIAASAYVLWHTTRMLASRGRRLLL